MFTRRRTANKAGAQANARSAPTWPFAAVRVNMPAGLTAASSGYVGSDLPHATLGGNVYSFSSDKQKTDTKVVLCSMCAVPDVLGFECFAAI